MHKLHFWLFFLVIVASLLVQGEAHASRVKPLNGKRVLLLLSYDPLFPSSRKIIDGISQTLLTEKIQTNVHYLHSKSVWSQDYQALLARFYLDPVNTSWLDFDLVITADDNAFSFMRKNRLALFGDIPWIFLGVNDEKKVTWAETQTYVTGLYEAPSFIETLDLAAKLFPDHQQLHVISDATPSGSADLQKLRSLLTHSRFKKRVNNLSLNEYSWTKLGYELRNLPKRDPILLLSAYKDNTGERKLFNESLSFIYSRANGPLFHMWEHGLGEGILGGVMINPNRHGKKAAEYALNVLKGKDINALPVMWKSPNQAEFDKQELDRFNLPLSALPQPNTVINHKRSFIAVYRNELIFLLIIGTLLIASIIMLLLENRKCKQLEAQLRLEKATLESLNNNTPDLIFHKDLNGIYQASNAAFRRFIGRRESEIVGKNDFEIFDHQSAVLFREQDKQILEQRKIRHSTEWAISPDGKRVFFDVLKFPNRDASGTVVGLVGIARDITQIHKQEAQNRLLAKIFDSAEEGMIICDQRGRFIDVNPAFSRITGFRRRGATDRSFRMLIDPSDRKTYLALRSQLIQNRSWQGELTMLRADGSRFPAWFIASPVSGDNDDLDAMSYIGTFSDISEMKETQDNLNYLAHHDPLTGMPNRLQLTKQLHDAIERAEQLDYMVAVLFIDLDRFKHINDSIGHQFGDRILCHIGEQITANLNRGDIAARLGGDEFVVVLNPVTSTDQVTSMVKKLFQLIQQPVTFDKHPMSLQASIGISLYPDDGTDSETLIKHADSALYEAKECGRNTHRFYTSALTQKAVERMELEHELNHALEAGQLEIYYQPIINIDTHRAIKAEALTRWNHPEKGMIPPNKFIPIAEDTGMVTQITDFVLENACKQMAQWHQAQWPIQRISVNISRIELTQTDIATRVTEVLNRTGCPAECLVVEVTESTMMSLNEESIAQLKQLRLIGVSVSIDDFGTGLSSLGTLKKLPLTELKIDRSFIIDMENSKQDAEIVHLVIEFSRVMGLDVVAEGVETPRQAELLSEMQCHFAQGYLYSKPLPLEAFTQQFATQSS